MQYTTHDSVERSTFRILYLDRQAVGEDMFQNVLHLVLKCGEWLLIFVQVRAGLRYRTASAARSRTGIRFGVIFILLNDSIAGRDNGDCWVSDAMRAVNRQRSIYDKGCDPSSFKLRCYYMYSLKRLKCTVPL